MLEQPVEHAAGTRPAWPDEVWLRAAVGQANSAALRMALYQQTGDPELAAMRVEMRPLRGGSMSLPSVAREHRTRLTEIAVDYLRRGPADPAPPPRLPQAEQLVALFGTPAATPAVAQMAFEELGFQPEIRDVSWRRRPAADILAKAKVLVVGAGMSGLAAAIKLKKLGLPFEVIERQSAVGGTWALNDYPEARVDVSNFIYQFKFEPNYPWRGTFAAQPEIRAYLEHIARKHGVMEHIRLNTALESATWDEPRKLWRLEIRRPDGALEEAEARFVIHAGGVFSTPKLPDIAGVEDFEGAVLHTTAWDHEYELAGKRVALIGTGSTGAQLMPHLARETAHLTVFQRTPNWILPVSGYHAPVSPEEQWLLQNLPYYWNWYCYVAIVLDRQIEDLQERDPAWIAGGGVVSARNDALRTFLEDSMAQELADRPDLLRKCRPAYPPAARRPVADNGWFQALKRPNVELVTDPIGRMTKDAVVTATGVEHRVDLIVMASGFQTSRYLWPVRYQGRGGATPELQWSRDGARAYLGVTMPNFPNLFIFYGPNGQARSGSFPSWSEVWARYALGLIAETLEAGEAAIEVRTSAFDAYNQELDQSVQHLIWDSPGANSYYLNEYGRSGINMPWRTEDYFARTMRPDIENYSLG